MKQGIKDWVVKLSENTDFAKKYEGKNAKEVSDLAKKDGFNFTAEEFMDLQMEVAAGGGFLDNLDKISDKVNDVTDTLSNWVGYAKKGLDILNMITDRALKPSELFYTADTIKEEAKKLK